MAVLTDIVQTNPLQVVRMSAAIGVCFHIAIARAGFEFEPYMIPCLALAAFLQISGVLFPVIFDGQSISAAIGHTFILWTSFSVGALTSLSIYRLFFHRLRKFPGPLPAKLTRFYAAYLNAQDYRGVQFYEEQKKLHGKYGDYMRIGPRELSILDPEAIPLIYGPNSKCRKSTVYNMSGIDPNTTSLNAVRDPMLYRPRRRTWDRGLSNKSVSTYQPRIKVQTDVFLEQIRVRAGQPMNITQWSIFYTWDVMGDLAFGKVFTNMINGKGHPAIQAMHKHVGMIGSVVAVPWLPVIMKAIGMNVGFKEFAAMTSDILKDKEQTFDSSEEPADLVGWLLKAYDEKNAHSSPTREALEADARDAALGGSETTGNTFANALFLLTKNPETQQKLRELLDAATPEGYKSADFTNAVTLPYLDAIIDETLRLKSPVIQGEPRETPAQGLQIGDKYIPGHVNVSVATTLIQRDPRWWKQPNDFIPERWTERREEMGTDSGPWMPFAMGLHSCAGKHLAYVTLRISIAAVVQNFHITFAPGETGEKFDGDFLSSFVMTLRPLQLVFTPRSSA